jgi:hypothetical protein
MTKKMLGVGEACILEAFELTLKIKEVKERLCNLNIV